MLVAALLAQIPRLASSQDPSSKQGTTVDLSAETAGAAPRAFSAVIGNWTIADDEGKKVLVVDGRRWKQGQPSAGLADKARTLYGERYAEFLDSVQSYAFFPLAIATAIPDFQAGEIRMRFKPISGRIDQGAGIAFDVKANGDYFALRANALENNLVLWRVVHGKRTSVEWVRNTPTATQQWHELRLVVQGNEVSGYLDGKKYLTHRLDAPVSGRVGVWSKADSYVLFQDYVVTTAR